ncbi:MAG: MFS transporter [Fimbriiglobus sp.]
MAAPGNTPASGQSPSLNDRVLFWASFLTLIAAGIGFSVRGAILKDWGQEYGFTQTELGAITGGGLAGFGLAIIFFSFCADLFGYGKLMLVAFLLHTLSAVVTFAAGPVYAMYGKEAAFYCLSAGMFLFALGNGTCEAVINPLTATLFPSNKTHWLNILHAGWPLGLIFGAVIVLGFNQVQDTKEISIAWQYKLAVFLVPVVLYGILMFNKPFPRSEASASGISMGTSLISLLSPILIFLFLLHALVGYVELGTDSWITNITTRVLEDEQKALLAFIWTNALMFVLRFFAGPIVHRINPIGLLFVSAIFGCGGLYLMSMESLKGIEMWMVAVTIYGVGKTFYWPTLLGVISERFPTGGALALGISGGIGMLSAGLLGGPGIGYKQDLAAVAKISELDTKTYERYVSLNKEGQPDKQGFPFVGDKLPDFAPPVAGLNNSKLKVMDDYTGKLAAEKAKAEGTKFKKDALTLTLENEIATINKVKEKGGKVEPEFEKGFNDQMTWWKEKGQPNYSNDQKKLDEARLHGAKKALFYTSAVPAALAVGFLLLFLYFAATGGYKQVHI